MDEQTQGTGGQAQSSETGRPDRRRDSRLVLVGVALVLLIWFAIANLQHVRIHFWVTSASAPVIVVIVISALLGAAASGIWSRRRRRRQPGGTGD